MTTAQQFPPARKQEMDALTDAQERAIHTVSRVGYTLGEVNPARSIESNRDLMHSAQQQLTILRSQIREMGRRCTAVDAYDVKVGSALLANLRNGRKEGAQ